MVNSSLGPDVEREEFYKSLIEHALKSESTFNGITKWSVLRKTTTTTTEFVWTL